MREEDIGLYECVISTEFGQGRDSFEINFSPIYPKNNYGYDENDNTGRDDPKALQPQNDQRHEISFFFIENDVRPFGQIVVLCESSKLLRSFQ